ncbi:MAG: efflux RND transporter periplasmic adaptor subunit [Bacteroidales bacterium]
MKKAVIFISTLLILASCSQTPEKIQKQITENEEKIKELTVTNNLLREQLEKLSKTTSHQTEHLYSLVSVDTIKLGTFYHYIEVQGKIDGDQNVAVFPEGMGGMTVRIDVKVGDKVSKGQVLAQLNDAAYKEQMRALKTNLELTTTIFNKTKALWEQGIGSEVEYLQIKSSKESLQAQVAALQEQIDMMKITAPVNGTIEEVGLKIGQPASPQFPAFRIINLDKFKVVADVSERYTDKIHKGDIVTVYLPDLKKELNAKIDFASKYINPVNRTFHIEAFLTNGDERLKANMIARMKIADYKSENSISIPVNYVQTENGKTYVMLAKKDGDAIIANKQFIKTGLNYNGIVEVLSGLSKGDLLITTGYLELDNNEKITIK